MTKQLDEPGDRDEGYAPLQNYAPLQGAVEDDEGDDYDGHLEGAGESGAGESGHVESGGGGGGTAAIAEHVQVTEEASASRLLALLEDDYARCLMRTVPVAPAVGPAGLAGAQDAERGGEGEGEGARASTSAGGGAGAGTSEAAEGPDDEIALDAPLEQPIVDQPRGGSIPLTGDDAERITRIVSRFTLNLPDSFEPHPAWAAQLSQVAQTAPDTKPAPQSGREQ